MCQRPRPEHAEAWCPACVGVRSGLGDSAGVAGIAVRDARGASALSAVVHEREAQMASQVAAEASDLRWSPQGVLERMSPDRRT